ncbi:centromere protein F [Neolamprologus brichardi]|uniref:centromere protein F n=1 Tax=Neolamprologus brichardi TaxID=32507 RepID=UPI001643DB29|nr:centromere protein F [Neolamprologus brichardi]
MSWAEEDWTVGLSGRVLQKVKELQIHHERLSRENKQKQLQLDNIHTSLEKQTVKYEEVRVELQSVQRELQNVRDEATTAVTSRDRLALELQTKQAQVCSLEGQLDAARTLNNKLTQEIKRLEAELEKLQNSIRSPDTSLFSTPCWNTGSPWEHNGSRQEEKQGHRDEGQSRAPHIRQRLQFSETPTPSLPQQQHKSTRHSHSPVQSDTFSTPLGVFPWERDDTKPAARRRPPPSPSLMPSSDVTNQGLSEQGGYGKDRRTETDSEWGWNYSVLSICKLQIYTHATQASSIHPKTRLKTYCTRYIRGCVEMTGQRFLCLLPGRLHDKVSNELSLAQTRMAQDSERASGAEQRLKQLQEELKCQRQNAESSRLQHQQRCKELEKQHQRDLTELQKERQCLEKQHQQEVNKLNQELQQARTLHNALQAQADKLSLQKQALEKELETLKEKLKWTEGQLKESQKKEAQTQAKLTEAVREAEGVAVTLEQSRKRERALEEEGRRLADERADTLRLLKELQEQKSAPPPQSVQFCPVGQSFSSQSSSSHHPRPSAQTKRPSSNRAEQRREEEDAQERRTDIRASYPSDREPGEGIDSEHISALISPDSSECLKRAGDKGKINEEENKVVNEAIECDVSHTPINNSNAKDLDRMISLEHSLKTQNMTLSAEKTPALKSEQTVPSEDLKKENAMLHSELQDVREELQKRLEDLEAQRRAETEARTRLKQLSRKHTSQAAEKEEKEKEWKTQLETERAETERLRRAMTALEADIERVKERGSEQEEEKNKEQQDRESEMVELNIQLKKQLAEVKAQLALEREEKKREEEERSQIINTDTNVKEQLSMKVAELKAQVEELKQKRKPIQEEKRTDANTPLTYLTLRDDELNSNINSCGNTLLPSPEQHLLFCQSTNQHNMLVSQTAADIIQEKSNVIDAEHSPLSDDVQMGRIASDPQKAEPTASNLVKEVERLKNENAKETERANQCQIKLEALQSQVTRQTQQLTMAFEKQSQHIAGLLTELQEKESALQSQKQELLQSKQELDELKNDKKDEVKMMVKEVEEQIQSEEQGDEKPVENSELSLKQEKESRVTCQIAESLPESDLNAQCDASQPETCDTQTATPDSSEEANKTGDQHPESIDSNKTQSNPDSACVMVETECGQSGKEADILTELLTLRRENELLKQRIEGLTISDAQNPTSQTDAENQDDPTQSQNTPNAALSCLAEDGTLSLLNDVMTEGLESSMNEEEDEGQDLKKEDQRNTRAEEDLEEMSEVHVTQLQQQVEALQTRVRALSEETQQQAEELAVWRLASQTAPTFEECETHELTSAVTQSQSNLEQTDEMTQCSPQTLPVQDSVQTPTLDRQKSQETITVIREDELLMSCSSNRLQGRMLFSRLQNSNLVEPKSLHPFKTAEIFQGYRQDPATADQESEKENQEINFTQWSENCPKVKRDSQLIQMTLEKMAQHHSGEVCEPDSTKTEAKLNTTTNSSDRVVKTEMKSVSSQTEESLNPRGISTVCVNTQTEEEEEQGSVDSPPVSPVRLSAEAASGDKILFSGSFPIPADPARLAERIRRNRTQLSAAFDDTEYEPYGLPEVVMKGNFVVCGPVE